MKKFFSITLLLTAMFLTFSACSSDDDEKNSLSGTEWVSKFVDNYVIIKFTSDSSVESYFTDANFVPIGRSASGTYQLNGNQVTFTNLTPTYVAHYKFESAEISGSSMNIIYYWKYNSSPDWGNALTDTFSKR